MTAIKYIIIFFLAIAIPAAITYASKQEQIVLAIPDYAHAKIERPEREIVIYTHRVQRHSPATGFVRQFRTTALGWLVYGVSELRPLNRGSYGNSAARLAHLLWEQGVASSILASRTKQSYLKLVVRIKGTATG